MYKNLIALSVVLSFSTGALYAGDSQYIGGPGIDQVWERTQALAPELEQEGQEAILARVWSYWIRFRNRVWICLL